VVNAMRNALKSGRPFEYFALAVSLLDHFAVVQHCMNQVGAEWDRASAAKTQPGGMVH
jgi:hypothetical protein